MNYDGNVDDRVRFDWADYPPLWGAHLGDLAAEQGLEVRHTLTILTGASDYTRRPHLGKSPSYGDNESLSFIGNSTCGYYKLPT